jgi:hypothetical protein
MWKKTFIRSTLILVVALAGIFVFATTHPSQNKPAGRECNQTEKESCNSKTQSSDFLIWESLSRAIVANAQF